MQKDFDEIIELYQRRVINVAYRFLNDRSDAEDIAQEVFLRVYRALPRYRPEAEFSTYLYKITKNLCLNHLRKKRLVRIFSLDSSPNPDIKTHDYPDKQSASPREILEKRELRNRIYSALDKLPRNQRVAVILKRYENLNLDEIGAVLGLSVSAVKSLLHRAKTRLKKELISSATFLCV